MNAPTGDNVAGAAAPFSNLPSAICHLPSPLDYLFITDRAIWPVDQGFCVHGTQMALALARQGQRVGVASIAPLPAEAPAEIRDLNIPWPSVGPASEARLRRGWSGPMGWPRRRLVRYLAPPMNDLAGAVDLVKHYRPVVTIGLSISSPMVLHAIARLRRRGELPATRCVWYAADDLVRFHLSCLHYESVGEWPARLWRLLQHGALETLFGPGLDGAIAVSPRDAAWLRTVAGIRNTVMIRNGVDRAYWSQESGVRSRGAEVKNHESRSTKHETASSDATAFRESCFLLRDSAPSVIFWGRMDYQPNVDAACWFVRRVWPELHRRRSGAVCWIVGKSPTLAVRRLGRVPGVRVTGEVADVRPYARNAAVTALPMRSGVGIKNKLLEAAAMARPIIASPAAIEGLEFGRPGPPLAVAREPREWIECIRRLWTNRVLAYNLGLSARRWVEQYHDWDHAACRLIEWSKPEHGADGERVQSSNQARRAA